MNAQTAKEKRGIFLFPNFISEYQENKNPIKATQQLEFQIINLPNGMVTEK